MSQRAACFVVLFLFLLLPQPAAADHSLLLFADRATITGQQSVTVTFTQPGHYALHDAAARNAADMTAEHSPESHQVVGRDRTDDPAARTAMMPMTSVTAESAETSILELSGERHLFGQTISPWSPPPQITA